MMVDHFVQQERDPMHWSLFDLASRIWTLWNPFRLVVGADLTFRRADDRRQMAVAHDSVAAFNLIILNDTA